VADQAEHPVSKLGAQLAAERVGVRAELVVDEVPQPRGG
jgi:hypothetical protein